MIFIIFFGLLAFIFIALNIYDNSNLQKIENYYLKKKCLNVIYSKGEYKGFCQDYILKIPNSFSPDLQKDKEIVKFNEINEVKKENLMIIINKNYKIRFQKKQNLEKFYNLIEERKNR
ncbi:hypothetical protein CRV01_08400 [Arcobacter sp. CECT 8983]|uniref:hypothetical protein n=1 Tax=Arcobacter sp. CECT 8983 TaxID=2044508 RepID=UPI00100A8F5D|nr:hypothetical protein [Arcobacter sp. CECT 8983]RXJ89487.1 hypothetical protein CRV01_08400 [Arcobacter sp. CECT 8983]